MTEFLHYFCAMSDAYQWQFSGNGELDVAIYGGGFVGFFAARRLAAEGKRVLLMDFEAALLWEATRALENRAEGHPGLDAWNEWLEELRVRGGANENYFEAYLSENLSADFLLKAENIETLFYVMPVGMELDESGRIHSVTVATKNGLRGVRAKQWVDASENGILAEIAGRHLGVSLPKRKVKALWRSLVLHTDQETELEPIFNTLKKLYPTLEVLSSVRFGEKRLRWQPEEGAWHRQILAFITELRNLGAERGVSFAISHCGSSDYPVYDQEERNSVLENDVRNLTVLSPVFHGKALNSLVERFAIGWNISLPEGEEGTLSREAERHEGTPAAKWMEMAAVDIGVAGAGTAGAVAAIAAGRLGRSGVIGQNLSDGRKPAKIAVFDFAASPGGIGTNGGITGYFHGAAGGLQNELDERSVEVTEIFIGARPHVLSWQYEAKIIALLERFEESEVEFYGRSLLCGAERDEAGKVKAVFVAREGKLYRLEGTAWIDSTGDGDLCALAGAEYLYGRVGDHRPMAYTQSGFWVSRKNGKITVRGTNYDAGWVDPSDPEDLTQGKLNGLAQFLGVEQTEEERLVLMTPILGLRQSRQIISDRMVTLADMASGIRFPDAIGAVETVADTHSVDYEFESDDLMFYLWTCRGFRHRLHCDLPYRMLLPKGLKNVWIACRAAGIDPDASTGLRMQREMQRLGETAGYAAVLSLEVEGNSRNVDIEKLLEALDFTGARSSRADEDKQVVPSNEELLAALDTGAPGVHLWHLFQSWKQVKEAVVTRLCSDEPWVSFYAAAICAMAKDTRSEARLIQAAMTREVGPTPEEFRVHGSYGQCIDIPFWLQAVTLLRRVGTEKAIPVLESVLQENDLPFNVMTTLALTLEQLVEKLGHRPEFVACVKQLEEKCQGDAVLPPSRSLWRTLYGGPQKVLNNYRGVEVRDNHRWQLDLVLQRIRQKLDMEALSRLEDYRKRGRGLIRNAFALDMK